MNSPGIRPPTLKPVVARGGREGVQHTLRVVSEDETTRPAAPNIGMPLAKTEVSELLACEDALRLRPRASATTTRANAGVGADTRGVENKSHVDSPATSSSRPTQGSTAQACMGDDDLGQVIDAWPSLPHNVRAGILAMIRATTNDAA